MQKSIIALTDLDEQARFFEKEDLQQQLLTIDLPGSAPAKAVARNLASLVREMRKAQKDYFAAAYGSPAKQQALTRSKSLEAKVDAALGKIEQTLNLL